MTAVFRFVVAFLTGKLVNLAINVVTFPVLADTVPAKVPAGQVPVPSSRVPGRRRSVSLLVPMRNEADRLAHTLPGILAQHVDELLLLDDCSTDLTMALLEESITDAPHAKVVSGAPTPAGWTGKTWAGHQLAELASSELLVFCDADVLLAPGAVETIVAQLEDQRADVLSVFPRQRTGSLGEHLLVPLIDDVLLCFLPFPLLRIDIPSAATANGSVLAFERPAYDTIGGFAAVRTFVVEDVALARLTRRAGLQLGLVLGGEVVQTRMYSSYQACVRGLGRGLLPVSGGSRAGLIVGAIAHLIVYTAPALVFRRHRRWALPLVLGVTERLIVEAKTGRHKWWQALLTPLSPIAALPVLGQALRRTQHWRGRTYGNYSALHRGVDQVQAS